MLLRTSLPLVLLLLALTPAAHSATIVKGNNTIALNLASSWVTNGPPGAADIAQWDDTVTLANTYSLGDNLQSWQGLSVTGAIGGNVIIAVGNSFTLGSSGLLHNPNTAARTLTINSAVILGATQTWTVAGGRTATVSTNISGTGPLTKDGGGILVLSGANTFSGGLTLNQGTVTANADASLGAPANDLIVTGSATLTATGYTTTRNIQIQSGATLTNSVNALLTLNGTISGAGTLRKADTGVLVLNGTNTQAATVIAAGELRANEGIGMAAGNLNLLGGGIWATSTDISRPLGSNTGQLQITGDAGFSAFGAPITINFGGAAAGITWGVAPFGAPNPFTLNNVNANAKLTFRNDIDLNGTTRTLAVAANVSEISGSISNGTGTAGITKTGAGVLWLTGTNTFNGTLTVNGAGGTLRARNNIGIPATANLSLNQDGIWESDENITRTVGTGAGEIQLIGAGTGDGFSAHGAPVSVNLGGAGATLVWGSATFVPSSLILNETTATHPITFVNGLDLNGGSRTIRASNTNFAGTITGVISHSVGTSTLTKNGNGTIILAATNTWAHSQSWGTNLTISAGAIQIDREENLGGTPVQFQQRSLQLNGGTLLTTASFAIDDANRGLYITATDGTVNVAPGTTLTLATPVDGAVGSVLMKDNTGLLILSNTNNNYGAGAGGRTDFIAGTIQIGTDGTLGNAGADITVVGPSRLWATATTTLNALRTINLNTNWIVDVTNGVVLTIAGPMNEAAGNGGALEKVGAGTLILAGNNDWNSPTLLTEGTLRFGAANPLPDTAGGDVFLAPGALLDINGFSGTINAITGTGTIDNTAPGTTNTLSAGANGASTTFSGTIQNTGGILAFTKVGAGTLTFNTPHTYSGATTITTGTLKLGAANVLPNGAGKGNLTVTALLDLAGFDETINGLAGAGTVTNSGSTATFTVGDGDASAAFTGVIVAGGPIALTKIGSGTQTVSGASTYVGDTTISAGKFEVTGAAAIPSGPGRGNVIVGPAGTLDVNNTFTINGLAGSGRVDNDTVTARILTVGANDQTSEFSGTITNSGGPISLALTKTGTGTLTLSGPNGYGGTTVINAGTLQIGNGAASGSLGTGNVTDNANLVFNRTGTLAYNGIISGTGTVTKTGTGTVTLGGASTYTGLTTIDAGTLQYNILNALPSAVGVSNVVLQSGATLDMAGFSGTIGTLLGAGTVENSAGAGTNTLSIGNNGQSGTFSGTIQNAAGALAITKVGAGTLTLDGTNTFSGALTLAAGNLHLGGVNTYAGNTVVSGNGSTLRLLAADVIPNGPGRGNVDLQTTSGRILDLNGFSETINGLVGLGTVTNPLATPVTLTLGDGDASATYSGSIGGLGIVTVVKTGAGIQVFSSSNGNNYNGDTLINAGMLRLAGSGIAIPDGPARGNVSVAAGATFDVTASETINGLSGAGRVDNSIATARNLTVGNNDQTSEFSGTITNSGGAASLGLIKTGTGTFTLSGDNGYGGVTTINNGTLQIGNGGTTGTLGTGNVANNSALLINRDGTYAYNGVISGTGTVTKTGAGTFVLGGVNTYTGQSIVSNGTLQLGASERIANGSALLVNGGTLDLQAFNETVAGVTLSAGAITGTGTLVGTAYAVESGTISARLAGNAVLTKTTAGTVTLSATNGYTGGTIINDGVLRVNNTTGSGTGTNTVTVNNGGTLGGTGAIAGVVSVNSGGIVAPGNSVGTLTLATLNLASGSATAIELNGSSNDKLIVTATNGLTIASGTGIYLYTEGGTSPWATDGTYDLFQYTGTLGGAGIAGLTVLNPAPNKAHAFRVSGGWVQVVITDSDFPFVSIANQAVTEGNAGTTPLAFAITLSGPSSSPITLDYSTANGPLPTRANSQDYVPANSSLVIPAGMTATQLVITVFGDTLFEGNETFTLTLTNVVHATLFQPVATGTINNDDAQPARWYVDDSATGNGNGFNWEDAFTNLYEAATAQPATTFWVAAGKYHPGGPSTAIQMQNGDSFVGGFNGTESAESQRNLPQNKTIISGDWTGDNMSDMAGAPLVNWNLGGENNTASMDGFILEYGQNFNTGGVGGGAIGNHMSVRNGAMNLKHCEFRYNTAAYGGAITYNYGFSTFENCLFHHNTATSDGGAIFVRRGEITMRNCTFMDNAGNGADVKGNIDECCAGQIFAFNTIFYSASGSVILDDDDEISTFDHCDLSSPVGPALSLTDCIDADPLFVNPLAGNYRLMSTSPCRDAGSSLGAPTDDLDGGDRPFGSAFDIGAYEYGASGPGGPPTALMIIVK